MVIAIIIVVVLFVILGLAATKPDTISIERTIDIRAGPERIYALVNDFRNWHAWAPQDKMDSTMSRTFGGATSGVGAYSEWTSSGKAGNGRMEITESMVPVKITVEVDFIKPFVAHNVNQFTLEPLNDVTKVTWGMRGTNPFIVKMMSVFINMDSMMGKHFEAGLRSLKALAES
jgi:hypothetical protein